MQTARRALRLILLCGLMLGTGCGAGSDGPVLAFVLDPAEVFLPQSDEALVHITLLRRDVGDAVVVEAVGAPTGVTLDALEIPAGVLEGTLRFTAASDALIGHYRVTVRATAASLSAVQTEIPLHVTGPRLDFDESFGTKGVTITPILSGSSAEQGDGFVADVLLMPERRILLAGTVLEKTDSGPIWRWVFLRYLEDGSLDPTFGSGGIVLHSMTGYTGDDEPQTMMRGAIRSVRDDKILAVGGAREADGTYSHLLARFHSDGSFDTTFGTAGVVRTTVGEGDPFDLYDVIELPDEGNPIVVAGEMPGIGEPSAMCIRKHGSSGAVDSSFGVSGTVNHAAFGWPSGARRVGRAPDGSLRVGGWQRTSADGSPVATDIAMIGLDASGNLDTRFGPLGEAWLDITASDRLMDMKVREGHLLLVGSTADPSDALISRYDASGFGEDPTFTRDRRDGDVFPMQYAAVTEIAGLAKYSVGYAVGATDGAMIARYLADGTRSPSEGLLGVRVFLFDPSVFYDERAEAVTWRGGTERRIVVAGTTDGRFAVALLWP